MSSVSVQWLHGIHTHHLSRFRHGQCRTATQFYQSQRSARLCEIGLALLLSHGTNLHIRRGRNYRDMDQRFFSLGGQVAKKGKAGRPATGKVLKEAQVMMRTTEETAAELSRIAQEMDRSVSWLLNDLAVKFITSHKGKYFTGQC